MNRQRIAFIIAVVLLGSSAITLTTVVNAMQLHFQKAPVALRKPLDELPSQLGPWLQVSKDEPLDRELEDVLGTNKYIFRTYLDTRKVRPAQTAMFKADASSPESRRELATIGTEIPDAVISVAVTYYTGMVDTVAHIPDRCYIADGYEPTSFTGASWDAGSANSADGSVQVRVINFEDQTPDRGSMPVNVSYFFECNGSNESDPLNGVRLRLQNLSEKYGYYAKIELKTVLNDSSQAQRVMADYLQDALPSIEQCLPDWKAVKASEAKLTADR